jgi:pimeloyl-ACP methyl ester carboxylesterase
VDRAGVRLHILDPAGPGVRAGELRRRAAVAAATPNPWDRLRAGGLTAPVLDLHGAEDPVVVGSAEPVGEHVPGARTVALPGAGHLTLLEQPTAVAAEVLRLIGGGR